MLPLAAVMRKLCLPLPRPVMPARSRTARDCWRPLPLSPPCSPIRPLLRVRPGLSFTCYRLPAPAARFLHWPIRSSCLYWRV